MSEGSAKAECADYFWGAAGGDAGGAIDGIGGIGAAAGADPGAGGGAYLSAGTTCMTKPTGFCVGPNGPATWFFTGLMVFR